MIELTSLPLAPSLKSLLSLEKEISPLFAREEMSIFPIPSRRALSPSDSACFLGDAGTLAMKGLVLYHQLLDMDKQVSLDTHISAGILPESDSVNVMSEYYVESEGYEKRLEQVRI
jgi:hypothetical protein